MYKTSHKDFACILNIIEAIQKIENYSVAFNNADDFYEDTKSFDAVMMNFVVIGEMTEKLSDKIIDETSDNIEWLRIRALRNIIAHNYFGIDAEEIWQIIHGKLKNLKMILLQITAE